MREELTALREQALRDIAGAADLSSLELVRVAITGKTVGPGLYDCLAILGASKSIARIDRARGLAS